MGTTSLQKEKASERLRGIPSLKPFGSPRDHLDPYQINFVGKEAFVPPPEDPQVQESIEGTIEKIRLLVAEHLAPIKKKYSGRKYPFFLFNLRISDERRLGDPSIAIGASLDNNLGWEYLQFLKHGTILRIQEYYKDDCLTLEKAQTHPEWEKIYHFGELVFEKMLLVSERISEIIKEAPKKGLFYCFSRGIGPEDIPFVNYLMFSVYVKKSEGYFICPFCKGHVEKYGGNETSLMNRWLDSKLGGTITCSKCSVRGRTVLFNERFEQPYD